MGDETDDAPEGWRVRQRPAVIAGVATPIVLLGLLVFAAQFYDKDLRPSQRPRVTAFPAPGVETFIHDGVEDPNRRTRRIPTDPRIEAAERAVARDGLAGWEAAR